MAAPRSMWNGSIQMGGVSVPVKLYSAVVDRRVHFNLLHERDRAPVRQRLEDPASGEEVPREKVRMGYEAEPGVFVLVEDEDLEALEPEPSRAISIARFVAPGTVGPEWCERPYYLGPAENPSSYLALVAALSRSKREGIARWAMRKRPYVGLLRVEDKRLALVTLRHKNEVVDVSRLPKPAGATPTKKERDMAEQLVGMLTGTFDPAAYHDEYRHRVEELIAAKSRGKVFRFERPPKKAPERTLEKALEASLASAAKGREKRSA